MTEVVIVGAGITGLATAIAIRQLNAERPAGGITVCEQSQGPVEVGAGLQIGPNAVKTLAHLGITGLEQSGACTPSDLRIMDGLTGGTISQTPLGGWIERRHGAPYHTMARADLLTALLERAAALGIDITYGARLEALRREGDGFALTLAGGTKVKTTALIGADGLWSQVRRKLRPDNKPGFTGQTAWRALMPMSAVQGHISGNSVTLWLAPGLHGVHYPVEGGRRLNFALFTAGATDATGWDTAGDKTELLARIEATGTELAPPLAALVKATDSFIKWPLFELMPSIAWGTGTATLVGDAAHPMLPYLAQGAAMGLEDGLVLAKKIAQLPDMAGAFRAYERARARRVMRVQRAARANSRSFHFSGAAAMARNAILRIGEGVNTGALLRRYDWLYGGGPGP